MVQASQLLPFFLRAHFIPFPNLQRKDYIVTDEAHTAQIRPSK
ncbi:unnamed protein product, partial [Allacma fusca]